MWPSEAWNVSYGTIEGWAFPSRAGSTPPISQSPARLASQATWASSSETSTVPPSPVRPRRTSAPMIPAAANWPATMSEIATATFIGSPSGSPCIDMMPPMPCMTKS